VGSEDFPRRVSKQVTGVEQETSVQGVRDKGNTSAAAEALFFQNARKLCPLTRRFRRGSLCERPNQEFGFKPLMHFSAYLMIAALVLLGLQLAYAFYQLATFML
jgi:hypothetical protein